MTAGALARVLTIGSRGSQLALRQAHFVAALLNKGGVATHIKVIKTTGDHLQTASLIQAGGKGLFTKEIEEALLTGVIDLAVHSLKDLPTEEPEDLVIAAIPEREDSRDAIVGSALKDVPHGASVGTSSGRRAAQLRLLRPDLQIQPIRGNIDTRLRKLKERQYHAIVLAAAGLHRLGLAHEISEIFAPHRCAPLRARALWRSKREETIRPAKYAPPSSMTNRPVRLSPVSERYLPRWEGAVSFP